MLFPIFVRQGKSVAKFKVGYARADGKVMLDPIFDEGTRFYEGMAAVKVKGRWGVINTSGSFVVQPTLWNWCQFHNGLASLAAKSGKYGVIDQVGNFVIQPRYDYVGPFETGRALVRIGESEQAQFGFIDQTGAEVISPRFRYARGFSNGFAAVKVADLWGYILPSGIFAITPRFRSNQQGPNRRKEMLPGYFVDGLAPVWSEEGCYRFIGISGSYRFDNGFDDAKSFHEGRAMVKRGERFGFIDTNGCIAIDYSYSYAGDFSEGLAKVTLEESRVGFYPPSGFINLSGQLVIPPKFTSAENFRDGLSLVTTQDSIGYINSLGEFVWQGPYVNYGVLL